MRVRIVGSIEGKIRSHGIPGKTTGKCGENQSAAAVFINARVIARVRAGAAASFLKQKETMGLLTGHPFYDGGELKLEIDDSVPLPVNADAHHVSVDRQAAELDCGQTFGESLVVGWYHSHTGQGNFLSETDRRTHDAWFDQKYAVAMVIEASENTISLYSKRDGALTAVQYKVFEE